jgi:hypothetical protein
MALTLNLEHLPKAVRNWMDRQGAFALTKKDEGWAYYIVITNDPQECEVIGMVAELVYGGNKKRIKEIEDHILDGRKPPES